MVRGEQPMETYSRRLDRRVSGPEGIVAPHPVEFR